MIPNIKIPTYSVPNIYPKIIDNYENINRLILIGNGFDIAHGLKSSFKDFIYHYCYNCLISLKREYRYDDILISIEAQPQIVDNLIGPESGLNRLNAEDFFHKFNLFVYDFGVSFKWKSDFFEELLKEVEIKNWVDIEIHYFDKLIEYLHLKKSIYSLNVQFDFIKSCFLEYLEKELHSLNYFTNVDLINQFKQSIKPFEVKPGCIKKNKIVNKFCILNFNYTNIAEIYSKKIQDSKYIPIHGILSGDGEKTQKPVFGFGDEKNEEFEKFEELRNDDLYTHIKSFKYLQFRHYRDLLEFIENSPFQVQIFGHSCGLSDRTLLNTIFEHENCISIKSFYYQNEGKDDFEQKSYSIARHFQSKSELRAKVVNKKFCEPMFQPK